MPGQEQPQPQPQARQPQGPQPNPTGRTPPLPNTTMPPPHSYPQPPILDLPPITPTTTLLLLRITPLVASATLRGCQCPWPNPRGAPLPPSTPPLPRLPQPPLDSLQFFAANRIQQPPSLAALACSNRAYPIGQCSQSAEGLCGTVHSYHPPLTMSDQVAHLISEPPLPSLCAFVCCAICVVQPVDGSLVVCLSVCPFP
jgi:hypothetical protein